jgi:NADH:ubiquinone oxidoreductase subunit 5 (subunit L)/multisubunit Na+/H+ antiporter MnhA subunit
VVLLATSTLGLGAMLAALAAGGVITSDLEPSADGPRAVGEPARPLALVAWCIGAATLIGAPLLPGFIPRQLMSVGILRIQGLGIPLLGLCWVGDALLALALLRAIAPALVNPIADATTVTTRAWVIGARDIPAAVLAALALLVGIAPALLLGGFSGVATVPVLGLDTLGGLVFTNPLGYGTNASQWAVGVAWITLALVAVVLYIMRPSATRAPSPAFTGGHDAGTAQDLTSASEDESLASPLTEPAQAWADLRPAFDSPWALPGGDWLLAGADDEESDDEAALAHDEPVAAEPVSVPVPAHAEEVADGER